MGNKRKNDLIPTKVILNSIVYPLEYVYLEYILLITCVVPFKNN